MIEGIVTSLKILVIGMGDRGSKSVIYSAFIGFCYFLLMQKEKQFISEIIVKEQRVDGSSVISILG